MQNATLAGFDAALHGPPYLGVVDELRRSCSEAGFDLVQPLCVGWYNCRVEGALRLEDFGSSTHLALVIGNTRALWPRFLEAIRREPELARSEHPLDTYSERCIGRAVSALGLRASLRWSHDRGERLVAMQRLAHVSGLAYLSECHLSVHPTYGPWIALRAAVSFAVSGPTSAPPELAHPCGDCGVGCSAAFEHALAAAGEPVTADQMRAGWQSWLACRDACPTGRQHRYAEGQIRYHYLGDSEQLRGDFLGEPHD